MPIFEYLVKVKTQGKVLFKKILFIVLYWYAQLFLLTMIIHYIPDVLRLALIILQTALCIPVFIITFALSFIEYEYSIVDKQIEVSKIRAKRLRKNILTLDVISFSEIGLYDINANNRLDKMEISKDYVCISSMNSPDVYYAIFTKEKQRCVLYFEAPQKGVDMLRKINPRAFRAAEQAVRDN